MLIAESCRIRFFDDFFLFYAIFQHFLNTIPIGTGLSLSALIFMNLRLSSPFVCFFGFNGIHPQDTIFHSKARSKPRDRKILGHHEIQNVKSINNQE